VDRLFLDANVLFSAAYRDDAGVQRLWSLEEATLLTSDYAIEEAHRNLREDEQRERLRGLLQNVDRVPAVSLDPDARGGVELREKDWPILGGAVAADATHLITGDRRDFGPFFGTALFGVLILPPSLYLASKEDSAF
jgi:predicted nucleic acid-binding protein